MHPASPRGYHKGLTLFVVCCLGMLLVVGGIIHQYITRESVSNGILLLLLPLCALLIVLGYFFFYRPLSAIARVARIIAPGQQPDPHGGIRSLSTLSHADQLLEHFNELIDREYRAEMLKTQAEIRALQSQINPHFLYNTLECIRGEAAGEGITSIANMAQSLSRLFRYSLESTNTATLRDELENVKTYFSIQQYRFSHRFHLTMDIDDAEHGIHNCILPRLTLQPLVENCIIHGARECAGELTIRLHAHLTQNALVIHIEDNGSGIAPGRLNTLNQQLQCDDTSKHFHTHFSALGNINDRIRLLYGSPYGISLFSTVDMGTTVEIIVPQEFHTAADA